MKRFKTQTLEELYNIEVPTLNLFLNQEFTLDNYIFKIIEDKKLGYFILRPDKQYVELGFNSSDAVKKLNSFYSAAYMELVRKQDGETIDLVNKAFILDKSIYGFFSQVCYKKDWNDRFEEKKAGWNNSH